MSFAEAGITKFALVDLSLEALEVTKSLLEKTSATPTTLQIVLLPTDVSSEVEVDAAISKAAEVLGRIDFCVNSAGLNQRPRARLHETTMESYDRVVNVNMRGLYLCQRAQVRQMLTQPLLPTRECDVGRRGSIVNIASISGIRPTENLTPYAASKAAVITMTKGDSQAYAHHGIRINAIAPGVIATPMNAASIKAGQDFSTFISGTPAGRMGDPSEIAHAALFLSHPLSTYIIGHVMVVDGGNTIS